MRDEPVKLVLDVPEDNFLEAWANDPTKRCAAHLVFRDAAGGSPIETVSLAGAYCVRYAEVFETGKAGCYRAFVTLSDPDGFTWQAGGAGGAFVAPAAREHGVPQGVLPEDMRQQPVLFRESTWSVERASPELLQKVMKRRRVIIALPGSDDLAYLDSPCVMAEAGCNDHDYQHIIFRENPGKAVVIEEFLHGTQHRLGIIDEIGRGASEYHVKDFMIRHQRLLGLSAEDVDILKELMNAGL